MGKHLPIALRYLGGKSKIAEWTISQFPKHKTYGELFAGGAVTLINKPIVTNEIYNDKAGNVVNVFRVLRDHGELLKELLRLTPYSRDEFMLSLEPTDNDIELARRTVIRSMMSFGGAGIYNTSSGFRAVANNNTSAPKRWMSYIEALDIIIERFRYVTIENRPAIELMPIHDSPETLYYLDPPYLQSTRVKGSNQYEHEMSEQDHIDLANESHKCKGMIIISGYHSDLYDDLYKDWQVLEKSSQAGSVKGGVKRTEVLWLSPNIRQRSLF